MKLRAFLKRLGTVGDQLLADFPRPFLLEQGHLEVEESASTAEREVFYLKAGDEPKRALLIGRNRGADVCIRDKNVSSKHAKLLPPWKAGAPWRVMDIGSTNGTFVNGEQLEPDEPREVKNEAVIGLGPSRLFVLCEPQTFLGLARRLQQKIKEETGEAEPRPPRGASKPRPDGSGEPLFVYCDPYDPIPLEPGQTLVVGRSAANADLALPHPLVSRRHAEIEHREDGVWARDLRSANGTRVGEEYLGGGEEGKVEPGVAVRIADFRIFVQGPPSEDPGQTHSLAPTGSRAIRGRIGKTMTLEDLFLSIEDKQKTGALEIMSSEVNGRITFRTGSPCQARTDDGRTGEAAIRRLLKLEEAAFSIDPSPDEVGEREIGQEFSEIVLTNVFEEEVIED